MENSTQPLLTNKYRELLNLVELQKTFTGIKITPKKQFQPAYVNIVTFDKLTSYHTINNMTVHRHKIEDLHKILYPSNLIINGSLADNPNKEKFIKETVAAIKSQDTYIRANFSQFLLTTNFCPTTFYLPNNMVNEAMFYTFYHFVVDTTSKTSTDPIELTPISLAFVYTAYQPYDKKHIKCILNEIVIQIYHPCSLETFVTKSHTAFVQHNVVISSGLDFSVEYLGNMINDLRTDRNGFNLVAYRRINNCEEIFYEVRKDEVEPYHPEIDEFWKGFHGFEKIARPLIIEHSNQI